MGEDKPVTLEDLARELGVTTTTVHRALHNKPEVSPRTREAVLALAEKTHYRPNRIARAIAMKKNFRIGVVAIAQPDFFWRDVRRGLEAAREEIREYGVELDIDTVPGIKTTRGIMAAIGRLTGKLPPDALALVPADDPAILERIARLAEGGMAVATYNDDLPCPGRLFYIGPQMERSGRLAARLMGTFLNGRGEAAILTPDIRSVDIDARVRGFLEVLQEDFPSLHWKMIPYSADRAEDAPAQVALIREQLRIESFDNLYITDGLALATAGAYLEETGRAGRCTVIGHEISEDIAALIRRGTVRATISQDPFTQGYQVIRRLFDYLLTGALPDRERAHTRLDILVREHVDGNDALVNPYY